MKGGLLALWALLTVAVIAPAQVRQGTFNQRGLAVQEMRDEGLCAAHPSLPIGSKARVTNLANNEDIEVTITKRLQASPYRVIDLSPSAALMLGFELGKGGPVIVRANNLPPPPVSAVPPEPPAEPELPKETPQTASTTVETVVDSESQPFSITINNYIVNPEKQSPPETEPERPKRHNQDTAGNEITEPAAVAETATPEPEAAALSAAPEPMAQPVPVQPPVAAAARPVPQPAARPAPQPVQPPAPPEQEKQPLFNAPPAEKIRIEPNLPDPNSDKVYRLHVGTYSNADQAYHAVQQLQTAGFDVVQEQTGEGRRVFAAGIPAARVYYAAQRLGAIGFQQVWVYE